MGEEVKEGIKRPMTFGEKMLAREIFAGSVNYEKVIVHCDSYFPFGLQPSEYAMAPNGELWFRKEKYWPDFSSATLDDQHTFLHEMGHVWQHQKGMWVRTRGLFSRLVDYRYRLDDKKLLSSYGMEQQASIISDYWLLQKYGHKKWLEFAARRVVNFIGVSDKNIIQKYEFTLSQFFKQRR